MKLGKGTQTVNGNEKILIYILIGISALFLYWYFLIQPALKVMAPVNKEVKALKEQVDKISSIQSDIKSKEEELKKIQSKYDEATKIIPRGDRYPQLLKELREMAISTSVDIQGYTLSKPKAYVKKAEKDTKKSETEKSADKSTLEAKKTPESEAASSLNIYTVTLESTGTYNNVLAFLKKIEDDVRIVDVKSVANKIEKSDNGNIERSTIELTYFISGTIDEEDYNFNTGIYGRENPFN